MQCQAVWKIWGEYVQDMSESYFPEDDSSCLIGIVPEVVVISFSKKVAIVYSD